MAVANVNIDIFAEMDQEIEAAKAKAAAGNGNAFFFKLEDGQRALVRFLLDLRECASVWKHEFYNVATNKYDVSAVCARSMDLDTSFCQHCQDVAKNKKLEAVKYFIAPVYVYGIKNDDDTVATYKNKEGKLIPKSGLQLMTMKGTAPLLDSLRKNYRELEEGDSFTQHDMTISLSCLNGDRKKPNYTAILKPSRKPFVAPEGVEIPAQNRDDIVASLIEVWKPALIDGPDHDAFGANPPAQSNGNGAKPAPAKTSVPDF